MGASGDGTDAHDAAAAVKRWLAAGQALAEVKRQELLGLTDAEALAVAEDLLDLLRYLPPRNGQSGLVEQQRVFSRLTP